MLVQMARFHLLWLSSILLYIDTTTPLSICLSMGTLFLCLPHCKWCCYKYGGADTFKVVFLFSLHIFPEVELLDLFVIFSGTLMLFSIVATPVHNPIHDAHRFPFLYILAIICCLFDDTHSNRHAVVNHCYFDWYFSNDSDFNTFSCSFWPFVYLLWKNDYSGLSPILKFGLFLGMLLSSICSGY